MIPCQQVLTDIKRQLSNLGEYADREARIILHDVFGISDSDLIMNKALEMDGVVSSKLSDTIQRRLRGEPLTRIFGQTEFWGLSFMVTPSVLDPRPDTEILVEQALTYARSLDTQAITILDLGTGSGCIALSLLSELPHAMAVGVDISHEALKVASKNAALNQLENRFFPVQAPWMTAVKRQHFDLIVSNPPYIRADVILDLADEVKNHDPILALSGGGDGMDCYKKIIFSLESHLKPEAKAFLEIGYDQVNDLTRLVEDSIVSLDRVVHDYGGNPRVVEISRGDK